MLDTVPFYLHLVSKALLHGALTRRQIGDGFGISPVAASKHARWLFEAGILHSDIIRMEGVKRPVEVFRVNPSVATGLVVALQAQGARCEVIRADTTSVASTELQFETRDQVGMLNTVRSAVRWGLRHAKDSGLTLDLAGLSVPGYLEPISGMIFRLHGTCEWEPCHLGDVIEELAGLANRPWTRVSCILMGLAQQIGRDDDLGLVSYADGQMSVANIRGGSVQMGRFGSAGAAVHQRLSDAPERCICGRPGCLDTHLRRGDCTPAMLERAMPRIIESVGASHVGVDWPGGPTIANPPGVEMIHAVQDPVALNVRGLRLMCVHEMLSRLIHRARPARVHAEVHPDVFRNGNSKAMASN